MPYRYCKANEAGWIFDSACRAYGDLIKDREATRAWFVARLEDPQTVISASARSVVVATLVRLFYDPATVRARAVLFWSETPSLALVTAFRGASYWAKSKGAARLTFNASDGTDIAPLAKRLGAVVEFASYSLEL